MSYSFPQWLNQFVFPNCVPFSLYPCQHLLSLASLMTGILAGMIWHLIVVFTFISLMINEVQHHFMYILATCISSLEKCLCRSSVHFLISCLGFFFFFFAIKVQEFLIYGHQPLIRNMICKFFSHSVCCLFILLTVSFSVQKIYSLTQSQFCFFVLFCFCFLLLLPLILVSNPKKMLRPMSYSLLLCFLLGVLWFQVLLLIHFELIFKYSLREQSSFILLHVAVQFSQDHLLKKLSFPPLYFLSSFVMLIDYINF